jgi:hypothetical protein
LPTIAQECGLSPSSTKVVAAALVELEAKEVFQITRSMKRKTHRCCPNMQWFRDEYALIQQSGRSDQQDDEFEELHQRNRPLDTRSLAPTDADPVPADRVPVTADRVQDPIPQGSGPHKEYRPNRTYLNEQKLRELAGASGAPADLNVVQGKVALQRLPAANDNDVGTSSQSNERRSAAYKAFDGYPKRPPEEREEFVEIFLQMAKNGRISTATAVPIAMKRYLNDTEPKFVAKPVKFLTSFFDSYSRPRKSHAI